MRFRLVLTCLTSLLAVTTAPARDLPQIATQGSLRVLAVFSDEEKFFVADARRRPIAFTVETFPTRSVVITRGRPQPPREVADLKSEKLGTLKGSFMLDDLRAAGLNGPVDDRIETGQIPAALKSGRITAGVDGIEAALVAKAKDPELQIGPFLGRPASLAYGVRKADGLLLASLDEYIANTRRTPAWSRLAVKYFGPSAPEILKQARGE